MTDDEGLFHARLIGERLDRVATELRPRSDDGPSLLRLRLHMDGLGPVLFGAAGTGLSLRAEPDAGTEHGDVRWTEDPPELPLTRFTGQRVRSVRELRHGGGGAAGAPIGVTLQFPGGSVHLLGFDGELLVLDQLPEADAAGARVHEDVTLARVVMTCQESPSQWDAWTTGGQYLYLRYRHGSGTVEQFPSEDTDTWGDEGSWLWTDWEDGTPSGCIELEDFLAMAGLRLAPGVEVPPRYRPG
ncbi:hypothetical protein [Streptomyces sp. NPDC002690]